MSLSNGENTTPSPRENGSKNQFTLKEAPSSETAPACAAEPQPVASTYLHAAAPKPTEGGDNQENKTDMPLPSDVRRILAEVAQTGTCSWLPWSIDKEGQPPAGMAGVKRPLPTTAPASAFAHRPATAAAAQQVHSKYLRSMHAAAGVAGPPRKKLRNGLHNSHRRRFGDANNSSSRKRPLFLIRTNSAMSAAPSSVFSPESVGSGRTSGSEPEDTSHYDSEGTSATSNSDFSMDRKKLLGAGGAGAMAPKIASPAPAELEAISSSFRCQRDVFRAALKTVLDQFYRRSGYKLSPAEKRRNATLRAAQADESKNDGGTKSDQPGCKASQLAALSAEEIFQQRRQRLLSMIDAPTPVSMEVKKLPAEQDMLEDGPPFTVQRVAEVLVAPERYYTQTHKLCNCLEKLLLITSSTNAFGGIFGGETSQSRLEEQELIALAAEQGRLQLEYRQRRLRHRASSACSDEAKDVGQGDNGDAGSHSGASAGAKKDAGDEKKKGNGDSANRDDIRMSDGESSRELLEAAARASLRTKFDHVGIDPHSSGVVNRDARSIAENRGMTNSPPPPSLSMVAAAPGLGLPGHVLRHGHGPDQDHPPALARAPSPILFNKGSSPPMGPMHASPNMQLLQMHHGSALSGAPPFELMSLNNNADGSSLPSAPAGLSSITAKELDIETRSSCSSDVDSESDVSFDDSASDRSDGSDSVPYEPFSAARAMALNRMQQQQRMQSRMLTSLHHNQGDGFRPDTEYQSGDSIDSTRAEDSGESDSSSSDMAD